MNAVVALLRGRRLVAGSKEPSCLAAAYREAGVRAPPVNSLQPRPPTRRVRLYDCQEQITGLPRTFVPGPQTPASTGSSAAARRASAPDDPSRSPISLVSDALNLRE